MSRAQKLLIAKRLGPLFQNVQECKMNPSWTHDILPSLICMQLFVFGTIEQRSDSESIDIIVKTLQEISQYSQKKKEQGFLPHLYMSTSHLK